MLKSKMINKDLKRTAKPFIVMFVHIHLLLFLTSQRTRRKHFPLSQNSFQSLWQSKHHSRRHKTQTTYVSVSSVTAAHGGRCQPTLTRITESVQISVFSSNYVAAGSPVFSNTGSIKAIFSQIWICFSSQEYIKSEVDVQAARQWLSRASIESMHEGAACLDVCSLVSFRGAGRHTNYFTFGHSLGILVVYLTGYTSSISGLNAKFS